ncbi:hypothetical protein QQF21_12250 [Lelliottia sp. V89_10]|nr:MULTISPECIES: hypothetical protein [unclassified Lelliottia]MDI3359360.1 hypothetical protein [Lelliottia sp. V89_13]MDK9549958.1 hypothetical protein [Lelliottia sp. V89_5]MDK9596378.1 hypothetical protein [Lelliottia sp. V89_10]
MGFYVKKLVSICGDELSTKHANHNCSVLTSSSVCEQLKELLAVKNGFYGFESALHVFPYESTDEEIGLLDSWQKLHGAIPPGHRLVPKIPFVTGGEYDIENLYLECTYKSLIARANLALQIRDIPNGNSIKMITQE